MAHATHIFFAYGNDREGKEGGTLSSSNWPLLEGDIHGFARRASAVCAFPGGLPGLAQQSLNWFLCLVEHAIVCSPKPFCHNFLARETLLF